MRGRVLELSRNGRVCNDERCPCGDPEFSPIYLFCGFSWSPPVPKDLALMGLFQQWQRILP